MFIRERNKVVDLDDQVMTKPHLRRWVAAKAALVGIKMAGETLGIDQQGPPLHFKPTAAASERDNSVNLMTARKNPGYLPARQLLFDALEHRADAILLDFGAQMVIVRHQIDGVWHNQPPLERLLHRRSAAGGAEDLGGA